METSKSRSNSAADLPLHDDTPYGNVQPLEVIERVELDSLLEELADVIESENGVLIP